MIWQVSLNTTASNLQRSMRPACIVAGHQSLGQWVRAMCNQTYVEGDYDVYITPCDI